MAEDQRPTARISLYWSARAKRWDIIVAGQTGSRHWKWAVHADATIDIDEGTGWLLGQALIEALEAQLY